MYCNILTTTNNNNNKNDNNNNSRLIILNCICSLVQSVLRVKLNEECLLGHSGSRLSRVFQTVYPGVSSQLDMARKTSKGRPLEASK